MSVHWFWWIAATLLIGAELLTGTFYVAAFSNIAKTNNTVIVPANLGDLASLVTSAMTVFKAQPR